MRTIPADYGGREDEGKGNATRELRRVWIGEKRVEQAGS
jgi:hypothetical protein